MLDNSIYFAAIQLSLSLMGFPFIVENNYNNNYNNNNNNTINNNNSLY